MKTSIKAVLWLTAGYFVSCSPAKFDKDASIDQEPCISTGTCTVVTPTSISYKYDVLSSGGKVDILFVNDNSGSMSFEQKLVAERFSSFLSALESQAVDYRIAITTTDISNTNTASVRYNPPRSINKNGALQDGRLIQFDDGSYFLTPSNSMREQLFQKEIQRPETKVCEDFLRSNPNANTASSSYISDLRDNCPSGDERGVFAANNTILNNPNSFIRPEANLAVIFLSDEDVASSNYYISSSFRLDSRDLPQTLISNIQTRFPGKNFSAHSIIVRPGTLKSGVSVDQALQQVATFVNGVNPAMSPENIFIPTNNDWNCFDAQGSQVNAGLSNAVNGSFGHIYGLLTRKTGGVEASICSDNYGVELNNIGASISEKLEQIDLKCAAPQNLTVLLTPARAINWVVSNGAVKFSSTIPPGTRVNLEYSCERI